MTKKADPPSVTADVKDLLLWARAQGIIVDQVTVGAVTLVCRDTRIATGGGEPMDMSKTALDAAGQSMYERMGGAALAEVQKEQDAFLEDDD